MPGKRWPWLPIDRPAEGEPGKCLDQTGANLLNHVPKRLAVLGVSIHEQVALVAQKSIKGIGGCLSTVRNRDRMGYGKSRRFSHLQLG